MRRVVTMITGLIGIVILAVPLYMLWLSWDGEGTYPSHAALITSDEEYVRRSNSLVSVPGANSGDTVLILPDTQKMAGAKASLDALSSTHILGRDLEVDRTSAV